MCVGVGKGEEALGVSHIGRGTVCARVDVGRAIIISSSSSRKSSS